MTPTPDSRQRRLNFGLPAACLLLFSVVAGAVPQQQPLFTIDEDTTAFAFGPGGRIAFAVHHVFSQHKFDVQRDDFWVADGGHGKRKILNGDKLARGEGGFSYTVRALHWSPGGTKIAADVMTGAALERHGDPILSPQSFLLEANGQEIKVADGDSFIPDSENSAWLDDATLIYLESQKSRREFAIWTVRPAAGHAERLFEDSYFLAVVWMLRNRQAVAITSPERGEKPRLVLLDLGKQSIQDLTPLDGYSSGLAVSPSGQRISYFRDPGTFEWRSVADPKKAHNFQALTGLYFWTQDEQHILLKSGAEHRSGIIQSLLVADGNGEGILHGQLFWNFAVSEDGARLGVSPPGKHVISVYDMASVR